jgi:Cytochrome P450
MTYVLRHNDEKGMSIPEIEATFKVLVVAGIETTGTALSGIMGYLLQSPDILGNLTKEIRRSFQDASAICADRASNLPYLGAVIEEGLRLCPAVALGMPRVVPTSGAKVSGHWLPGGVSPSSRSLHNSHRLLTSNLTISSDIRILLWLCLQPFESKLPHFPHHVRSLALAVDIHFLHQNRPPIGIQPVLPRPKKPSGPQPRLPRDETDSGSPPLAF